MNRRHFLSLLTAAALPSLRANGSESARPFRLLLRSSWNIDNIGDIAHTPGMLALLEAHLPGAEITLAPWNVGKGVDAILGKRFPRLRIMRDKAECEAALETCDFFLHGSGPGLLAGNYAKRAGELGIPYGIGGVTLTDGELKAKRDILDHAEFVFTRDTQSLESLKSAGCTCPIMDFGPDATFALDLRNESAADQLMQEHGLEAGKFLCAIPRLRWTPTWDAHPGGAAKPQQIADNETFAEPDHAKIRAAITAWVRETKMRVLLAPEMTYAVPRLRGLLFDGLPEDVKPSVVSLDRFWFTDEAASVIARSAAMVSIEQHAPIIAIASGVPAILLCQPIPPIRRKGQMWPDLGMERWFFEIDACTGNEVAARILEIADNLPAARQKACEARDRARQRMNAMMDTLKRFA